MSNVLTWTAPAGTRAAIGSRRLAALQASHHAMWNYVTYRDGTGGGRVGGPREDVPHGEASARTRRTTR